MSRPAARPHRPPGRDDPRLAAEILQGTGDSPGDNNRDGDRKGRRAHGRVSDVAADAPNRGVHLVKREGHASHCPHLGDRHGDIEIRVEGRAVALCFPIPMRRAAITSGRAPWLSIVRGSATESPRTEPSAATIVTRASIRPPSRLTRGSVSTPAGFQRRSYCRPCVPWPQAVRPGDRRRAGDRRRRGRPERRQSATRPTWVRARRPRSAGQERCQDMGASRVALPSGAAGRHVPGWWASPAV